MLCNVLVLLVKHPAVPSETTAAAAVGEQPGTTVPGRFGRFWLRYESCHKNSAGVRGWSQRLASAEHLAPFVLIAVIYN